MNTHYELLSKTSLFRHIPIASYNAFLDFLSPTTKNYKSNSIILNTGDVIHHVGIIVKGSAQIYKDDYWGNRSILTELGEGDLFGEVYAFTKDPLSITVEATSDSEILFIDIKKIFENNQTEEASRQIIINFLHEFANKNLLLAKKIDILSKKSIREKILTYLTSQAIKHGSNSFIIPFNRQELADYLCVDRSALSNELSKLRNLNYISFKKNKFILLKRESLL